jgi:hypothetical protein
MLEALTSMPLLSPSTSFKIDKEFKTFFVAITGVYAIKLHRLVNTETLHYILSFFLML